MSTLTTDARDAIASHRTHRLAEPTDDPGDAAHIVMTPAGEPDQTPQAYVLRARIEGFPVTALCGYTWVPEKDPKPLPVCSGCFDIYTQPGKHRDERDELPDA